MAEFTGSTSGIMPQPVDEASRRKAALNVARIAAGDTAGAFVVLQALDLLDTAREMRAGNG